MATFTPNAAAPAFTGEFRHKVEGKNRVTIPSPWRFGEETELFMIVRSIKRCIAVMTREEVERHKSVATAEMSAENRARFLDLFGRKLRQATLDKAGRITIPEELCKELGIERELWLSGAVDTFNIWNLADFEAEKSRERPAESDVMRQLGI